MISERLRKLSLQVGEEGGYWKSQGTGQPGQGSGAHPRLGHCGKKLWLVAGRAAMVLILQTCVLRLDK